MKFQELFIFGIRKRNLNFVYLEIGKTYEKNIPNTKLVINSLEKLLLEIFLVLIIIYEFKLEISSQTHTCLYKIQSLETGDLNKI